MKYLVMLLLSFGLLVGCQQEEGDEPPEPAPSEEQTENGDEDVEQSQDDKEKLDDTEKEQQEVDDQTGETDNPNEDEENVDDVESPDQTETEVSISVEEARTIVEENLTKSIDIMQQLQREHQEWVSLVEGTDEYNQAVEATKESLKQTIASSSLGEWAKYYFDEFFVYNHFFAVLQPSSLNARFEVTSSSEKGFILSFIQLGDEAFNQTMQFHVNYVQENGVWKFNGYQASEINEPLNLTFNDLKNAYMDGQTLERYEGKLLEEFEHNGQQYLLIQYGPMKKAININTGYDESYVLEQR